MSQHNRCCGRERGASRTLIQALTQAQALTKVNAPASDKHAQHKNNPKKRLVILPNTMTHAMTRILASTLLGTLAGVVSLPATALEDKHLTLEQQLRQAPGASLDDIARQIRRDHNWRILAAEPRILEKKTIYRFKLLNRKRGRVKVIEVEPAASN